MDLTTFIITGPSTITTSAGKMGGGGPAKTGAAYNLMSTCATDTFSVSEAPNIPTLCGTLTGDHCMYPMKISATFNITIAIETHIQFMFIFISVYFDVSQNCHTMAFSFGQTAIGTTTPTTRSFTIKVIFINILTIPLPNFEIQ